MLSVFEFAKRLLGAAEAHAARRINDQVSLEVGFFLVLLDVVAVGLSHRSPVDVANLVAGLNNWAVDLLRCGQHAEAAARIEQGLQIDPSFAPLVANQQLLRTVGQ